MSEPEMKVVLSRAEFVGTCFRCHEPSVGSMDSDEDDGIIKMKCVNCGFKTHLETKGETLSFVIGYSG